MFCHLSKSIPQKCIPFKNYGGKYLCQAMNTLMHGIVSCESKFRVTQGQLSCSAVSLDFTDYNHCKHKCHVLG